MSDRDKLTTLLNDFGIGYELEEEGSGSEVVCTAKEGGVAGYISFITMWSFDHDGKFIEMGIWE